MGNCAVCQKPFFPTVSGRQPKLFRGKGVTDKFLAHESCGQKLSEDNFKSEELQELYVKELYRRISH